MLKKQKYNLIIEKDPESGWLVGEILELPGCYTQAKSIDGLIENIKEAIKVYLNTLDEDEKSFPEFIGTYCVEV
jgi:predicted RNase H-like HicB family nuclease